MAGKPGRSGRPRKADELKILYGTYYHYRDGDPDKKPSPESLSAKPAFEMEGAAEFWDEYVPMLTEIGIAKETDAPRLQIMCELWALLRMATTQVAKEPLNKDARIAYAEYGRQFATVATEFGLTPSSRSRIVVDKPKKPAIAPRSSG